MGERGDGLEKYILGQFSPSESDPEPVDEAKLKRANKRLQAVRLSKEGLHRNADGSYEIDPYAEPEESGADDEEPEIKKAA